MTIGERIKNRREELGMSQEELAQKIGYKSRSSINKIELGIYDLKRSKVKEIADALLTTPAFIMGWEEPTEKSTDKKTELLNTIQSCSDDQTCTAICDFMKLDDTDRKNIIRMISAMLSDEKYSAQEKLKNA